STLHRLSSQIHCHLSLSLLAHQTTTAAALASSTAFAKVFDRLVKIFVVDQEGHKREILGLSGHSLSLLKALNKSRLIDPTSH
ncbi:hypothetical protein Tsubulata_045596, partial [Turnera subulata]